MPGPGCRVTVRFKLIALIYGSIISSLSKSGIDAGNLRGPASRGKVAILLGMPTFLYLRSPNDNKAFLILLTIGLDRLLTGERVGVGLDGDRRSDTIALMND